VPRSSTTCVTNGFGVVLIFSVSQSLFKLSHFR